MYVCLNRMMKLPSSLRGEYGKRKKWWLRMALNYTPACSHPSSKLLFHMSSLGCGGPERKRREGGLEMRLLSRVKDDGLLRVRRDIKPLRIKSQD